MNREYRTCTACSWPYVGDNPTTCQLCVTESQVKARKERKKALRSAGTLPYRKLRGVPPRHCMNPGCDNVFEPAAPMQATCSRKCGNERWKMQRRAQRAIERAQRRAVQA